MSYDETLPFLLNAMMALAVVPGSVLGNAKKMALKSVVGELVDSSFLQSIRRNIFVVHTHGIFIFCVVWRNLSSSQ